MSFSAAHARSIGNWAMLNLLWLPLTFQDTALMTIAVPAATLHLAPRDHVFVLAVLASISAFAAMVVPPWGGWLSDRLRRRGASRRQFVAVGIVIDVVALVALAYANSLLAFAILLTVATAGANLALCAYQALLPELVPRAQWGAVSGVRGAATLAGAVLGFAIAGAMPDPRLTFLAAAAIMAVGGLSLLGVGDGTYGDDEHAHVRDWHDFIVVFVARTLVFFGLIMLQTFVLYFFRDVVRVDNPSAGTALYAFATIAGAVGSSIYLGLLSDRMPRKVVTALAGAAMATATIGFALAPSLSWILPFAVLFGIGFGGVISSGWALAMDAIPKLRDVARDLGLWGIATLLPNVVAPLVGGWLIGVFHGARAGYQAVFGLAGFSFALASLTVLRVGRKPISSLWAVPVRAAAVLSNFTWDHLAYRVRNWGRLPWRRGPTLIVANHQHDFESPAIVVTTTVQSGPWRHPVFTASSRRMYEPGFLAERLPWLSGLLRRVNAGPLFVALGMLPLENELGARQITAWAWSVQQRHGRLPLAEVFEDRVAARFAPGTTTADLRRRRWFALSRKVVKVTALREPFRRELLDETRQNVERDLARMEDIVRRGGTFYLTPEGRYSLDGRIGTMRGVVERLAPLSTIYLAGVSYDPFVSKRFSMLYRVIRFGKVDDAEGMTLMTHTLASVRPVVTSQLLSTWLLSRDGPFGEDEAIAAVHSAMSALPAELFVDPELRRDAARLVRKSLPLMIEWKIVERDGERYRLAARRRHPQFPFVDDIVAHQAAFFDETMRNAAYARPYT
ncbi:MAG: MFS transporter [Candidatus Eremiobacteraeota bacterium]|nr:MFS transporter [Candidatus Eremiobacteraeota bacterium]